MADVKGKPPPPVNNSNGPSHSAAAMANTQHIQPCIDYTCPAHSSPVLKPHLPTVADCLTASKGRAELYVDMYDCDGVNKYARYSYFHVEGSSVNYKLHISGYSGTARDSFNRGSDHLNGMQFSTWDRDNDRWSGASCAAYGGGLGGWWFNSCFYCNLNGPYVCGLVQRSEIGVLWQNLGSSSRSLKYTEIKMRFI